MDENLKAFELWDKGEYSEAIQVLFNQIEENPENMASYYNLANMLLVAKKEEDAKAVLLVANEKSPYFDSTSLSTDSSSLSFLVA